MYTRVLSACPFLGGLSSFGVSFIGHLNAVINLCSCGRSWYEGQFTESCRECSGFAMHRPCPICRGHCGKMWQRNVDMVSLSRGYK